MRRLAIETLAFCAVSSSVWAVLSVVGFFTRTGA